MHPEGPQRLQKILAAAGVASRRASEELIAAGRVTVDGQRAELGDRVDPTTAEIHVDGERVVTDKNRVYLAINKPRGVVSTMDDERGRAALADFLPPGTRRVYHVGRLDADSEGLLLLTNDGDFANKITHAKSEIQKVYVVKTKGALTLEQEKGFREGVPIHGKKTAPAGLKLLQRADNPWYEVKLIEGRQNQIKLMFRHYGLLVEKLKRVKIGFLELGTVKPGKFRHLTEDELSRFQRILKRKPAAKKQKPE